MIGCRSCDRNRSNQVEPSVAGVSTAGRRCSADSSTSSASHDGAERLRGTAAGREGDHLAGLARRGTHLSGGHQALHLLVTGGVEQVSERGAAAEHDDGQARDERGDRPRRARDAGGGHQVVGDLARHPEGQRAERGPLGELACPVGPGRVRQPHPHRERGVGLDADRQRDRRVDRQAVPDPRQEFDRAEPGQPAQADPAAPDRHERGQGQQQERPRRDRPCRLGPESATGLTCAFFNRWDRVGLGSSPARVPGRNAVSEPDAPSVSSVQRGQDGARLRRTHPELGHDPVPGRDRTQVRCPLANAGQKPFHGRRVRAAGAVVGHVEPYH